MKNDGWLSRHTGLAACCAGHSSGRGSLVDWPVGNLSQPRSLVCRTRQAVLQSSELGVRTGLDGPVRAHGARSLAGAAVRWRVGAEACGSRAFLLPACAERLVVGSLLWLAQSAGGIDRDRSAVDPDCDDHTPVLAPRLHCGSLPLSARALGRIRRAAQFRDLAAEWLTGLRLCYFHSPTTSANRGEAKHDG